MRRVMKEQINFNTILLMVIGTLVGLYIHKADAAFTELTRLQDQQIYTDKRVSNIETIMGIFNPKKP